MTHFQTSIINLQRKVEVNIRGVSRIFQIQFLREFMGEAEIFSAGAYFLHLEAEICIIP